MYLLKIISPEDNYVNSENCLFYKIYDINSTKRRKTVAIKK